MLTKNFYSFMRGTLQKKSAEFTHTNGETATDNYNYNSALPPFNIMNTWAYTTSSYGVAFGTSTTPATVSDYYLENILDNTQISVASPSGVSYSRLDAHEEYSVTFGITNITSNAITIAEVGLIAKINDFYYALVDRTVLDTPVTIPAGQSKQITYTIRFNYGDAA